MRKLKKSTSVVRLSETHDARIYFELGRKPLYYNRKYRMLKYWIKLKKVKIVF